MSGTQDWKQMRERIIGLGEESSRKSFYPELQQRLTQLEQAREELRRSSENLRTVFNAIPDAIFVCDTDWHVLEVNAAALDMFGVTRENFHDHPPFAFTHWEGLPRPEEGLGLARERLQREGHFLLEWTARRPGDGSTFEVEGSLRCTQWHDQEAFIVVVRDVTERKRLETMLRQSQKLDALGQLAGGMAHDTNNMLGVILGYSDLLEEKLSQDPQALADLGQVRKAALRSSDLIRQLLAFARKQTIQPRVTDLNSLVEDTQKMLRRLIGENIALVWKPATVLGKVWVDPSQIDQVLANLVVNARDSIEGSGTITLETGALEVDETLFQRHPDAVLGSYVCLCVTDTGRGMTPEIRTRIFEPFFTTKEAGRGTGLGLATVYGILRQNGGFISLDSEPGVGSTFRLCFPLHRATELQVTEREAPEILPGGTETVLLVEDEEDLLTLEQAILVGAGYRVISTSSPREAQRLAHQERQALALLVTDLVMPEMNGWELHQWVSLLCPDIRSLFMSGYSSDTIALDEVMGPGRDFLQKPFTRTELLRKVRQVLDAST
jgi:PAS domain S-box-containing protein